MWLTDGFVVPIFGSWRGAVHKHTNSCTATIQGSSVHGINVQGNGSQTSEKLWKTSNLNKGGREHWVPYLI